jgi:hypothetical protein
MTKVKGQSILSYNSLVLKTENAEVCVTLAVFTSFMEALNDTEHCISETNGGIWIKLTSYVIHVGSYEMTHKTLL